MSGKFSITPIAGIISAVLASTTWSSVSHAEEAAKEQDKIIITGSRIKRTDVEGASTVVSMTAEEMQQQGFTNLYDALSSFTSATGSFVGEQFAGGFQANAQALNFRGLGPGRTLYLLDGKRIADYPSPYNGESNFVNLSQIPMAMIERVEVMAGGASAIYGSDAMAGVVNVITKKNLVGQTFGVRVGDTVGGGADSSRFQWYGGTESDKFSNVWALEYYDAARLEGNDRPWLTSGQDFTGFFQILRDQDDSLSGVNFDCDVFGYNSTTMSGVPVCMANTTGSRTVQNERQRWNLFNRITFPQGDYNELSIDFHLWNQEAHSNTGPLFYNTQRAVYVAQDFNTFAEDAIVQYSRVFTEDEIGNTDTTHDESGADISIAYNGVTEDFSEYEIRVSHSFQDMEESRLLVERDSADAFFFGTFGFTADIGIPVDVFTGTDYSRLTRQLTPAEIAQITGTDLSKKNTAASNISFTMTGDLMSIGSNDAKYATIVEWNRKDYEIDLDPRTLSAGRDSWIGYTGTEGEGERDSYGLGVETLWPITDDLNLTLAGRYDKYDDETAVDDAWTYNLGIEYRPVDGLLIRSTATSNFRAPDMHLIYANAGGAFYNGTPFFRVSRGNPDLEEETGKSQTLGVVYEPMDNMSFSIDFYQLEFEGLVEYEDGVLYGNIYLLCQDGSLDPASALCQFADSRVTPDSTGTRYDVLVFPVNTAYQLQQGVDTSFKYSLDTSIGRWAFTANHTNVLKSEKADFAGGDVDRNYRNSDFNGDLRSRFRASATWMYNDWRATLMANRRGSVNSVNATLGEDRLDSWTTYNLNVGYDVTPDFTVDFIVNNLTNEYPRLEFDRAWPYYNTNHYNALRRSWFVEGRYTF